MTKKIIAIISVVSMLLATFTPIGVYAAADTVTADILIDESFNKMVAGSVPTDSFEVKRAGGADMSIVNKPDEKNKSLFITGELNGTASIGKIISNPENVPLTLSFKFNLSNKGSFKLIQVDNASATNPTSLFEVVNGNLTLNGETLVELETNRWYYAEVTFNAATKTYAISIDNNRVIRKADINDGEVGVVRLMLSDTAQKLYLDEVLLRRADRGIDGQEYYKYSELFVSPVQNTSVEDIATDSFLMYQNSPRSMKNGTKIGVLTPPFEIKKVMYLPVRFTTENLGAEVIWNDEEKTTFLVVGENTYKVKTGESTVCHNGSPIALSGEVVSKDGAMYMPATDLAKLLDQTILVDEGLIMLGGVQELYTEAEERVKMEVRNVLKYERPTGQEMYDAILERYPDNAHPRLHGGADDFARIRKLIQTDETAKKMYEYIKKNADSYLNAPVTVYPTGSYAKEDEAVQERCTELGFMYQITGEDKYAERAWKEIDAAISFPEWNKDYGYTVEILAPSHMANGIAYAYDWTYDWIQENLSSEDINRIKTVIYERLIDNSLKVYRAEVNRTNSVNNAHFWATDEFNFNPARNGAVIACCIAFAEDYPEDAAASLGYAMRGLEFHFDEWMPDGAWTEGPDYGYVTVNMDAEIISLIEAATGTDYGLSNIPGLVESATFHQYILGPKGFFNYGDANKQTNPENSFSFLYAAKLNDKSLGYLRKKSLETSGYNTSPEEMFWYRPELVGESANVKEKDGYFRTGETALLRSDWSQDAIFTGIHAHDNNTPHSQLDTGTIVLDAFDTEWFTDLAYDQLSYTNLSAAYGAYRARAEGHNTIVIDETPYNELPANEDGWLEYQNYDWEDQATGETPTIFDLRSTGDASVTVEKDTDNPKNQYLELRVNGYDAGNSAFYYHHFPAPYINKAVRYDFKLKLKDDVDWVVERNKALNKAENEAWQILEIAESPRTNYNFPILLTKHGWGTVTQQGWINMLPTVVPGIWYDISLELDVEKDTYTLTIDGGAEGGKAVQEDLPLQKPMKDVLYIRFNINTANTSVYVDDIKITLDPVDSEFAFKGQREFDQNRYSKSIINRYASESQGAYAITDLTKAYEKWVDSAERGLMLTDQRRAVVVRDEFKLKKPSDVYWFAHMRSETNVEIAEDGKSAILSKNGQRLWVGLLTDSDAKFEVRKAKPMPGSPDFEDQMENNEFKKLTLKFAEVTEINSSVAMIPLLAGQDAPTRIPEVVALADWTLPEEVLPTVSSITVDGALVNNFDPSKNMYDIFLPDGTTAVPQVAATADGNVTVTPASKLPGYTVITVEKDGLTAEYIVNFRLPEHYSAVIQGYTVTDDQITVNQVTGPEYGKKNVLDGNFYTRWSCVGREEWLQIDFQEKATLSKLGISWWIYGDARQYEFEVQMSDDAANWKTVYKGISSGTTEDLEEYDFGASYSGRYMRIVFHGWSGGTQTNIAEIR